MKHYRELDWPSLPEHVHQQLIEFHTQNSNLAIPQLRDRSNNAVLLDPKTPEAFERKVRFLNRLFPYRVNQDGSDSYHHLFGVTTVVKAQTGNLEPHTDISRVAGFYYVLDGEADTVWYRWKNGDTEAGKSYLLQKQAGELEELDRVKFKKHRWYLMDFGSIHGVENPEKSFRYGLGINLCGRVNTWQECCSETFATRIPIILQKLTGVVLNLPPLPWETDEIISEWNRPIPQSFPQHDPYEY